MEAGAPPQQREMPFAVVDGEPVTQLPQDLYIPPYALKVFLEAFEGPLDLLLYLIKRQNLDILNVPIAQITVQYTEYIELMREMQLELAGDYLVMAAMLAEIKSRMLLPRPASEDGEEEDPRAELIRRLQEYERYKQAATDLDELPRIDRDHYVATVEAPQEEVVEILPDIDLKELLLALQDVMRRAQMYSHHQVQRETLSVRERMGDVLSALNDRQFHDFVSLFDPAEGRMGVSVTFLAVLQLVKESLIELVQAEPFAEIHVKAAGQAEEDVVVPVTIENSAASDN
ncbi:MAG: ScpA family protein [Gammaproteobacteria bacterium]